VTKEVPTGDLQASVTALDHVQGADTAPVTMVEYADYECPYSGMAYNVVKVVQRELRGQLRFVYRNFPLRDIHPHAQHAAEAAEAAANQGSFWEMHDLLLANQDQLAPNDLAVHAEQLGLDAERVTEELRRRVHAQRVSDDVASADESGVSGTPTFFVNGRRHYGAYDIATLTETVQAARRRARLAAKASQLDAQAAP
jgi:protein-disulfide isomerase